MSSSRRDLIKGAGSLAALVSVGSNSASSADSCTAKVVADDTGIMPRMPLDEFVKQPDLVEALRRGVAAMKKRKPSDPLSWFFQAAIHGVELDPNELGHKYYKAAEAIDPDLAKVDRKYWNQCPHFGVNSANFLPWHRAYTFHFEQILREHTGKTDFSLPYWNYKSPANRKFPEIFGREHLDGNPQNDAEDNINPLFMKERDFYLTYYEHPLIPNMPILELTDAVVDDATTMATDVFFGETEVEGLGGGIADDNPGTRGLMESRPHDNLHRVIGGIIPGGALGPDGKETDAAGAMAVPKTAGFDPIFPIHHANIDRLWAEWSCTPGKKWGKLPDPAWFAERPWYFFDTKGNCVNEPRSTYFDYRKLGIRFKYEEPDCTYLALPDFPTVVADAAAPKPQAKAPTRVATTSVRLAIGTVQPTTLDLSTPVRSSLATPMAAVKAQSLAQQQRKRLLLRLTIAALDRLPTVGFDVHVSASPGAQLTRASRSFVGTVNLFVHAHHGNTVAQDFDVTRAVSGIDTAGLNSMRVLFVPFALTQSIESKAPNLESPPLQVRGIEFLEVDL
ncbi:MAG: tyrosinase family protein [Xanthobacteraceae bacterium]